MGLSELFIWIIVFILAYLVIYYLADYLIDMLKDFSHRWKISPVVSGILILGIDLEESIVSILAAANKLPYLALGNLIGNTVIAIAISFGIPSLLMTFKMEEIPRFYLVMMVLLGGMVLSSMMLPQYLFVFGAVNIALFSSYFLYTIRLQKNHANSQKMDLSESFRELQHETREECAEEDDFESLERTLVKIGGCLVVIFIAGELLVLSAENIIDILGFDESFFGLVIMAFVTNVEEFWLIVKAIQKHQVALGVSAEIGKISWNLSLIHGISAILLQEFAYRPVMVYGAIIMSFSVLLLAVSIYFKKMTRLQSLLFIGMLVIFLSLNVHYLFVP